MRDTGIPSAAIGQAIASATGARGALSNPRRINGGDINVSIRADFAGRPYFIKLNRAERLEMFEVELEGLSEISSSATLRVPRPVCSGSAAGSAFLVLEYLPLGHSGDTESLGRGLAAMHRVTREQFGWDRDNTIGSTPQVNRWSDSWADFFAEHRLGFQLETAARNGHGGSLQEKGQRLLGALPQLFEGHRPRASLLHGDLWSGNHAFTQHGEPVIFDPAVYFGDRETDLAMTELFGGFPESFYAAYCSEWPLDPGYETRRSLYQLYHVLNHMNLFGGTYRGRSEQLIEMLLAALEAA